MAAALDELVEKLKSALAQDLISIVLYGSAAVGDNDENFSDLNVLCILSRIEPEHLAATETVFRWWREQGNPSPLLLTKHEVQTSTDCFAIEFTDIRQHNRILFGDDVVSNLAIDRSFYRAQVEHELRAKLLRLRQKASGVLSDKDVLCRLLSDSLSTFCVLFRHALLLRGFDAPGRKRDIIESAGANLGIDGAPFQSILDIREQKRRMQDVDGREILGRWLTEIGKVIDNVDVIDKTTTGERGTQ